MNPATAANLFSSFKAEHEPWLARCFVLPKSCEQVASHQSSIIWGRPGSGKSALCQKLAGENQENILVAKWSPEPPTDDQLLGTPLFNFALERALRAILESLVLKGNLCKRLDPAQGWMLTSLTWFLRKYLPFEPVFYVHSHGETLGEEQVAWYLHLLNQPQQNIMAENASNTDLLRLFLFTIKAMGYQSVTLLVDGVERWSGQSDERAQQMLDAILSTLAVFDSASLFFKFFVPETFRSRIESTAGVVKYRVNEVSLTWDAEQLTALLAQRVGLALGQEICADDFCAEPKFWNWLSKYSANNPRSWLELARPFVHRFFENPSEALNEACWRDLAHSHPPVLRICDQKVWLAECEIHGITATEFDLLEYLEKNSGRICSLDEIYYRGLKKLARIPSRDQATWNDKDTYRGVLDTALYRLRQKIEADPAQPIYLVTRHGKGVEFFPRGAKFY